MLRVLVTDNDPAFLKSLRSSLVQNRVPLEIFEASSGEEALALLEKNQYDALTLDVDMPGMSGLETLERVRAAHPNLPVLMLTFLPEDDESVSRALQLGANGYLYKWKSRTDFLSTIERIVPKPAPRARLVPPRPRLSSPEAKILRMLGAGKTEDQIAKELALGVDAINAYKDSIYQKLGFKNEAEINRYIFWLA